MQGITRKEYLNKHLKSHRQVNTIEDVIKFIAYYDTNLTIKQRCNKPLSKDILELANKLIMDQIMKHGLIFYPGYGLGRMFVRANRIRPLDYNLTKIHGFPVRDFRDYSYSKGYRVLNVGRKVPYSRNYKFVLSSIVKKRLFKYIKDNKGIITHY